MFTVYIFHGTKTGARINFVEKCLTWYSSRIIFTTMCIHGAKLVQGFFVLCLNFGEVNPGNLLKMIYHLKRNPERTFQNEQRRKTPTFGFKVSSTWHRQGVSIIIPPKTYWIRLDERNRLVGWRGARMASFG